MADNLTMNWDTVYAIPYRRVNETILASGSSPKTFTQQESNGQFKLAGDFGAWQVTPGGAGKDIHMAAPIKSGVISIQGQPDVKFANVNVIIEVNAEFIPNPDTKLHDLRLITSKRSDGAPAVSVLELQPAPSNSEVATYVPAAMTDWFNANLDQFNHAFASVDLNLTADKEAFRWMTPTKTSYAVAEPSEGATPDNCVFGVMCMTEGRDAPNLGHNLSVNAIPKGAHAGFLISTNRMLEKLVMPGLPVLFMGKPGSECFELTNDGLQIQNTKKLKFQNLKLKNGVVVSPSIDSKFFTVGVDGAHFVINLVDFTYAYDDHITVGSNYTAITTFGLDENEALELNDVSSHANGSVQVAKSYMVEMIIAGIALSVGLAALGWGAGGAEELDGELGAFSEVDEESAQIDDINIKPNPKASEEDIAQMEQKEAGTAEDEVSASESDADEPTRSDGFFKRNKVKIKTAMKFMAAGGLVQGMWQGVSDGLRLSARGDANRELKLSVFSDAIAKPIQWADKKDFKLTSVQLNGCMQFGGTPHTGSPQQD